MCKKERLYHLDILKFLAIFCVCYGHCIQHFLSGVPSENPIFRFIYSFHMPLFMAITGYFCYTNKYISFYGVIKKKLRQLILPGICFAIAIPLVQGFPNGFDIETAIHSYWFLKSAFICAILYYSVKCLLPAKLLVCGGGQH